ncbi:MAG: response regulator [Actinomycetota bacterium]|nr:response regulator [Actinomycetota bacterium]
MVIVEDSGGFRVCLRAFLESEDFEVIAEAVDGSSAVPLILGLSPSLVLLDIVLPDISGFVVADRLASGGYRGTVVLVSSRCMPTSAVHAAPVAGFVAKEAISGETLRRFIEAAA